MEIPVEANSPELVPSFAPPSVDLESTQHPKVFDLPLELTTQIFSILCQPVIFEHLDNPLQKAYQPTTPLFLGSICRLWRAIVWNTPALWCFVLIMLSEKGKASPVRHKLVEEWLLRTRNLPLTIILNSVERSSKSDAQWDNRPPNEVLSLLVKHAEQWETVDMLLPSGYGRPIQWNTILAEVNNRLPLLTSLSLRPPASTGVTHVQLDMFHSAPLLRHLTLDMYYVSDVKAPWSQLVSLRVESLHIQECLQILSLCRNLRQCQIDGPSSTDDSIISSSVADVRLKHLLSLKVTDCESGLISSILNGLHCPALQELHLDLVAIYFPDDFIIPALTSFFIRSSPVLKVLSLSSFIDLTDNALLECLELIPSLETLALSPSSQLDDDVIRLFLQKLDPSKCLVSGSTVALPNLQRFTLTVEIFRFPAAEFLEVIKNRWNKDDFDSSIKQLKFADITLNDTGSDEEDINSDMDLAVVQELLKEGMDITFDHQIVYT